MRKLKLFFACLLMAVLSIGQVWAEDPTDELTATDLTATTTNYVDFSNVAGSSSDAVYAGSSAKDASGNIQLRSKNSNSGIISTTSGGKLKSVTITVGSGSNTVDVYGSNTAYTSVTDLFNNDKKGTKIGSVSATGTVTVPTGDNYAYVGIRSNNGAIYLSKIEITWVEAGCSSEVTITKGAETNGTYTLSAAKICADGDGGEITISNITPDTGYEFDEITTSASGTVDNDLKKVTGIKAATTITVKFKAIPQYTVTWNNNGATSTSQVYEGAKPEFPATPAACDATSTTFIGWATAPWTGKLANLDDKTVYTKAADMPAVNDAVTYYAVFAQVSGASGWNLTDIADLTSSDVFVLADASNYALNNDGGASNAPSANAITVSDGKITSEVADNLKWNVSGNATDGYTFYPNGTDESWLYCSTTASSSSNNCMRVGTGDRKVFEVNASGYLVTKDTYTARYLSRYDESSTPKDFRGYVNTNTNPVQPKCYKYSAGSASNYMTTCCTKYDISIADGITNGSISADLAKACEDAVVTITFSPAGGYHLESWSVNGTDQDVNENTFSMPAEDVEVSATFAHDACSNLDAPTLNGTIAVTYNSATINWSAAANASSYDVAVVRHSDSESIFSGNLNALTKALADLAPETQYDYSIMGVGDGATYCASGNGVLEGNFTTESLPTAHLTLIDPSGTHAESGDHPILTPFNLPSTAASCAKTFMGWDPDDECATAPTYTKGQSFTFLNTTDVTLYAVYADVTGGSTSTTDIKCTVSTTTNMTGGNDADLLVDETDAADAGWIVTGYKGGGSNYPGLNKDGTIRLYYNASGNSYIDVTAPSTITSIEVTCKSGNDNIIVKVGDNTISLEDGVYPINATSFEIVNGYASSTQVHIQNIAVNFTTPGTPSNYSTTCAAAPEAIVDPEEVNAPAAGVANGVIVAAYDNVNESAVAVALYNNAACTEAFTGSWLTASINDDKNIAYTIAENTSYNDARTAYIKLTAPETTGATAPAVVVIPVSQAKKAAVFSSLEELVDADVNANTDVTVSFSNVTIKSIYYYPNTSSEDNRKGVVFNIQKAGEDIKIYFNAKVSEEWVPGGTLSGTLTDCPWKIYSGAWQLAPAGEWAWDNLTYSAPAAIESLEIRGNATKTTYIDGQAFDHTGLKAWAIYSDSHEEDVTTLATWTYNPAKLSESDTEVTVTATYAEQSDDETVTGLTVNPIPNKTIAEFIEAEGTRCYLEGIVSGNINTTYGNFDLQDETGTIYVYGSDVFEDHGVALGDKVKVIAEEYLLYKKAGNPDKDEALNVVFVSKVSAATIDIDDINMTEGDELLLSDIVATITPDAAQSATINYEVTEGTAVTISEGKIIASTEGVATITASIAAGEGYLAGSTTFIVTVSPAPVPFEGEYFVKVADNSELTAGEYLIVYEAGALAFDGSLETLDAVGNTVAVTFDNGKIQGTEAVLAATFTIKLAGTIKSASGYYIGQNSNANGLASSTTTQYSNIISIDDGGNAVIKSNGGAYLRYNDANNQTRFRYYKSSSYTDQKAIQLYKKENAAPVYETVRDELNPNEYYTMCLDKAVTAVQGATIWKVFSKAENEKDVILEEVEGTLDAGRPYIFYATADKLEVVYNGAAVSTPIEEGNNGLIGSFIQTKITQSDDNYIIYNNALYFVNSDNVYVGANRAYLDMNGVPAYSNVQGNAPGRRRVTMAVHGKNAPTGIDAINASEAPVKMVINGQLFILRGEKMYDATGRLVK